MGVEPATLESPQATQQYRQMQPLTAEDEVAGADETRDDRLVTATDEQLSSVDHTPAPHRLVRGRRHDRVVTERDTCHATIVPRQLQQRLTRLLATRRPDPHQPVLSFIQPVSMFSLLRRLPT